MPELPEVEVCRQGLLPGLKAQRITGCALRFPRLRREIPPDLATTLTGRRIDDIRRRGKYLLFACSDEHSTGWLIIHLGMSGSLRFVDPDEAPGKHDHFDLLAGGCTLRFCDPRRFGLIDWVPADGLADYPLLAGLGVEPLSGDFDGAWLFRSTRGRTTPIKPLLMDARQVVGIGNIYAAESLFRAGIAPDLPAGRLSRARCDRLAAEIRATLLDAIAAGGSTIRNYLHSDGSRGYFQVEVAVYDRAGLPCRQCGHLIGQMRQAGRSTFFCPICQQ